MKIIEKKAITDTGGIKVTQIKVQSPEIARKALPGQFVVLMTEEMGERIPLTIVKSDARKGEITLIFQEVGLTTKLLGRLNLGDSLFALAGPLGHATEIKNYGKVVLVAGGVGIAEILPVAEALKKSGNQVIAIIGARSKNLLILENELKEFCDSLLITTDDGSYARKGFTTDALKELLEKGKVDLVYAVGPIPMMRKVALTTKDFQVKTVVSLNAIMVDATGMCGSCRVSVAGKTKFSCVDGPEFDAHEVDWDELIKRNKIYVKEENHVCKMRLPQ